jgi:hypothetical protein
MLFKLPVSERIDEPILSLGIIYDENDDVAEYVPLFVPTEEDILSFLDECSTKEATFSEEIFEKLHVYSQLIFSKKVRKHFGSFVLNHLEKLSVDLTLLCFPFFLRQLKMLKFLIYFPFLI